MAQISSSFSSNFPSWQCTHHRKFKIKTEHLQSRRDYCDKCGGTTYWVWISSEHVVYMPDAPVTRQMPMPSEVTCSDKWFCRDCSPSWISRSPWLDRGNKKCDRCLDWTEHVYISASEQMRNDPLGTTFGDYGGAIQQDNITKEAGNMNVTFNILTAKAKGGYRGQVEMRHGIPEYDDSGEQIEGSMSTIVYEGDVQPTTKDAQVDARDWLISRFEAGAAAGS